MAAHVKFLLELTAVEKAWQRKARRVMHRVGAYGRTTMRRLFRPAKKPSPPGGLPRSHPPHNLRNLTLYGYDAYHQSVVIGPRKITPKVRQTGPPIPGVLSEGATVRRVIRRRNGTRTQTARHAPRPYRGAAYTPTLAFFRKLLHETPL